MKVTNVKTLIFTGYGINSERELAECFERAGSTEVLVCHINEMIAEKKKMLEYDIIAFAGGFSYGDYLGSGKIFANKMKMTLKEELSKGISEKKPVLGICNGFQVLVAMGLICETNFDTRIKTDLKNNFGNNMALIENKNGRFENRWINLKVNKKNKSFWLKDLPVGLRLPVRHQEGRCVFANKKTLKIAEKNMIALQYVNEALLPTQKYPYNPNGSQQAIAGLTNEAGNILGLMPHPEAFFTKELNPLWQKEMLNNTLLNEEDGMGLIFFNNAVRYVRAKKER